jgi:hypothetical protein
LTKPESKLLEQGLCQHQKIYISICFLKGKKCKGGKLSRGFVTIYEWYLIQLAGEK